MERDDWNQRWEERGHHYQGGPSGVLTAELASMPPARALDLACGGGRNAIWLAKHGWRVTAVDFSDTALDLARKLAAERGVEVEWVGADVREYEPEPGAFDLVLVCYLHVPAAERRAVLARAASALAPGGTLVVLGHDLANLGTGAPGPSNPSVLYTAGDLTTELDGLDVEKAEQIVRRVETESGEADAVDTLVLARRSA